MLNNFKTIVIDKKHLAPDIYEFTFKLVDPVSFEFQPGEYMILKIQGKSRLYSIASSSKLKDQFQLLIEIIPQGLASAYLQNLAIGEEVCFQGTAGAFRLRKSDNDKIFFATGTGIAPILSMIFSSFLAPSSKTPKRFILFWGLKTLKDVHSFEKFKALSQEHPNFKFYICLSQEKSLEAIPQEKRQYFVLGRVNRGFEDFYQGGNDQYALYDYYLCGSRGVVESLKQYFLDKHIPPSNIFFEKF